MRHAGSPRHPSPSPMASAIDVCVCSSSPCACARLHASCPSAEKLVCFAGVAKESSNLVGRGAASIFALSNCSIYLTKWEWYRPSAAYESENGLVVSVNNKSQIKERRTEL